MYCFHYHFPSYSTPTTPYIFPQHTHNNINIVLPHNKFISASATLFSFPPPTLTYYNIDLTRQQNHGTIKEVQRCEAAPVGLLGVRDSPPIAVSILHIIKLHTNHKYSYNADLHTFALCDHQIHQLFNQFKKCIFLLYSNKS